MKLSENGNSRSRVAGWTSLCKAVRGQMTLEKDAMTELTQAIRAAYLQMRDRYAPHQAVTILAEQFRVSRETIWAAIG